ncbi:MAG: Spy/CpxP family protein refolding chaperone [Thermoguttaceae bacterium]
MLRLPLTLVSAGLGLLMAASLVLAQADGQQPGERGPKGGRARQERALGQLPLIAVEPVQKELKLSDEQKEKVKSLIEESSEAMRGHVAGWRDMSEEERKAKVAELRKKAAENVQKFEKGLAEILTPEQRERLHQLRLQLTLKSDAAMALNAGDIAKALGLSQEQREKLKGIREATQKELQETVGALRDVPPEERREKFREISQKLGKLHEQATEKAMQVLTPEQQQKLEKLKGKKFEIDLSALRRPPREETPPAGRID